MRIGARVRLLVAVPLLGLCGLGAAGFLLVQRTGDDGERRADVEQAARLRDDIAPAAGSLLRAWAEASAIAVVVASDDLDAVDADARVSEHLARLDEARAAYDSVMERWAGSADTAASPFVLQGGPVGEAFFTAVDSALLPALDADDTAAVLSAVRGLESLVEQQQAVLLDATARTDARVAANRAALDDDVERTLLALGIGAAGVVVVTLLLAALVRRSVVRPTLALTEQVRGAAQQSLPVLAERLHHGDEAADEITLPAVEVRGKGELAALAAAVNELQAGALEVVAEQATARRALAGNLVHVARRNQLLVSRALGFVSSLEESERDPKALDNLFRIDHLTTRMRRTAQSLLLLADAAPDHHPTAPVAIGDVVRAALSEVEQFGNVELADLGDVQVKGIVAGDLSLLLAELLENATSFSPPNSPVTVVGRAVPGGHQLAVFDHGIGLSDEGLVTANARLADDAAIERDTSPHLGFKVVARLAARHGIRVTLTSTPGGAGVTAVVQLPALVLEGVADPAEVSVDATEPIESPLDLPVGDVPATGGVDPSVASPDHSGSSALPALPTRVPGAQLPTLGVAAPSDEVAAEHRAPDEVRDSLAGLQRGTERGRSEDVS